MKAFKSLDLIIQVLLLALLVVAYFIGDSEKLSPIILVMAFAVVQIISILVHLAAGSQVWKKTNWRKFHLIGTALVLALIVVALIQDSTARREDKYSMPGLETLIYATIPAIGLALFYTLITWLEWIKMKKTV
jgi:hypothetical protein